MSSSPTSAPIQTVTGAQIPLDAAYIANLAAQNALTARGQDINAQISQAQMATQAAIANGNNATQLAAAQLSAMTAMEGIQAQLHTDMQTLGQQRAQLLYQQRLGQVQGLLDYNGQMLQAQGLRVDSKFRALELLASRSGPQDYVAYNNLLNQMGAPTGQMVDPTQFANDITNPERPDFSTLNVPIPEVQGYTSTFNPQQAVAAASAAIPQVAPAQIQTPSYPSGPAASASPPAQSAPAASAANNYIGVPLADVKKGWNLLTTGSAGDFNASDLDPSVKAYDQNKQLVTGVIKANTPYWFERMANGGTMRDMMAIVGDASMGQRPDAGGARPEVIVNPTRAPIAVIPHEQAQQMMGGMRRFANGTGDLWQTPGGHTATASGEFFDPGQQADASMFKARNDYVMANTPQVSVAAPSASSVPWGDGMDARTFWTRARFGGMTNGRGPLATNTAPSPASEQAQADGSSAPVFEADNPGNPGGSGPITSPGIDASQVTTPPAAPGSGATVLNPDGTYGMPGGLQYTVYSPEVLGKMPYLGKLFGGAPNPEFQGFGAQLSVPGQGIANLPDAFSLQRFSGLMPSEQDMVRSLYTQGAAMDWNDLMGRIRRATPLASQFSGGPVGYGAA